jgi:DNA repair ATPase RecN
LRNVLIINERKRRRNKLKYSKEKVEAAKILFAEVLELNEELERAGSEKEIQFETSNAMDALKQGNLSDALIHCDQASKLLAERNKKCKALKGLRE